MAVTYQEGRIKMTAGNDASKADKYIIRGVNFIAANGQGVILQDQNDKDIIRLEAETGNLSPTVTGLHIPCTQVKASTLDGGQVIIYI